MADRDETDVPAPEELNPDGTRKKDLRYTAHEDRNVRVDRQLDGSGHLARGDVTRMSVLNFSSRHQARTERDPEFTFRPPPAAPPSADAEVPPAAAPASDPPTMVTRIRNLFGL